MIYVVLALALVLQLIGLYREMYGVERPKKSKLRYTPIRNRYRMDQQLKKVYGKTR